MANPPKSKTKAKPALARKPAMGGGKAATSRARVKPIDSGQKYVVFGTVSYLDKSPTVGLTVIAYDKDESGEDTLGQATTTDATGAYKISYNDADFRRTEKERGGADVVVRVYNAKQEILFTSKKKNSAPAEYELNITVPDEPFVVRGRITDANQKPLAHLIVRAFERDLRIPQLCGTAETDANGEYRIAYHPADFLLGDVPSRRAPWLVVEVHETTDGEVIARQEIQKAAQDQTIPFTLANVGAVSEWQRISEAVAPLLRGQGAPPVEMDSYASTIKMPVNLAPWDITPADVDFIVQDAELDRAAVEAWVASSRMVRDAMRRFTGEQAAQQATLREIGWPSFYSLARPGLARDLAELWSHSTDDLIAEFKKSIEVSLVPRDLLGRLDEFKTTLNQLRAARLLEPAPEGKPSSLGDLLGTLPPEEALSIDQQLTFAKLRDEHGDTDNLWEQAEASGLSEAIPALKRTLALDELTEGHTLLVNALQTKSDVIHPESLEFLTALKPTDWIELVFEHGVPPGIGLDRDAYIERLQSAVEVKFPSQMLSKQLEKKLGKSERFPTGKVVDFLKANPNFDLRKRHVEPYLNEIDNRDDSLREGLLRLGRIHALTANARETMALHDAGIGSSTQIVSEGKPAFMLKVGNQLSAERAEQVFAAAEYVVTTLVAVGTAYGSSSASGNAVHVIPAQSVSEDKLKEYPSLRSLFGDLDYCECRHCRSVLGPAAYLADLLHFLQRSKLTANNPGQLADANHDTLWTNAMNAYLEFAADNTVLGALLQRRPDLADLEFSCENTDTKIPYIDLVLEILENAVALPLSVVIENVAGIDIDAEFAGGRVPVEVAAALRKTAIKIGKTLTVSDSPYQNLSNPLSSIYLDWIITDGSRRWLVKHLKHQFLFLTSAGLFRAQDITGAVDSLKNGTLSAELKDSLSPGLPSQGLPIDGAPQIEEISLFNIFFGNAWKATYTRAIAIKITISSGSMGAVELLKLDGTPLRAYPWSTSLIRQYIAHAFTSDTTSKINPNVAQLLGLPANETYLQTWNPTKNWWELSVTNTALVYHLLERLYVSGLTHQNSSIREHLTSSSENRNPAAYYILSKNTVYPWALPFDLWLEETRAFLDALGVPRAQLIDIARPQLRLFDEAASLELLGLSKSEADLITPTTASSEPWIYWGLAKKNHTVKDHTAGGTRTGGWLELLVNLSMLLQQSGLSYREYLDFRQSWFAGKSKGILLPPNECRTSNIALLGLDATEFTDHLNRIHVFTRLWRKSGWSMRELDLALAAFGGQITPTTLKDLAVLKRLSAGLGLPVSVLVACIDGLDTQAWTDHTKEGTPIEPSLYDSVFQRQSLRSLTGFDDFALEKLDNTTLSTERAEFVAASLGIKPAHVKAWINPNLGITDPAKLELISLSRLYAAASLCRALRIAPEALPDIVTLLGSAADPFSTLPTPTTSAKRAEQTRARALALLEFVERTNFVRKSGFDFETLSYLLRHKVLPGAANDVSTKIEQQLTKTLTELRSALQAGVVLGDVSADNVRRQLARLGWYPSLIDAAMGSDGFNHQPGASVEISPPLPTPDPVIPLNLRSKFTYRKIDAAKAVAVLECSGSLKDADFISIDNLFPTRLVTALKTNYQTQLDAQTKTLASLLQMIELAELPTVTEVVTGLTALPVIPGELKDRLKFEVSSTSATEGKLTLTGRLSDAEKEAAINANPLLSTVLISLQAKALVIPAPTPQTLEDAEQLLREPDVEKRYRSILLRLVSRLEPDLLVAQLSGALGADPPVISTLLDSVKVNAKALLTDSGFLRSDPKSLVDRKAWPDQFKALELLGKIATLVNRLTIKPEQLDWILGDSFAVMDVLALPPNTTTVSTSFDDWRKLVDLFHLRDVLPDGAKRLAQVYEALTDTKSTAAEREDKLRKVFAEAFELDQSQADTACGAELLSFDTADPGANDYHNPSRLLALAQLLHVIKTLGTTAIDVIRLTQPTVDKTVAPLARTLFAASLNAHEFPERLRPISNKLRNLQRNALVAYLIHHDHLADSNELFDRYLIDVEMGSCMLTSRIKQAISSVQLFVQRCLLNLERPVTDRQGRELESGVSPDSINTQRWPWMQFYRVWEANRKVFLYPENWIEPELRDDKTEIFRAFESDLLQSEITHDSALVAFRKYLDKMADIANLTVVSMFEEKIGDDDSIVHLVGRDNSEPYKHYYRQWKLRSASDFGTWTAWEEISAQVDSVHVLVFLFGGSVYLAWPTISSGKGGDLKWKIGMNLAKRSASGWTKLKKGRGEIENPMVPNKDERTSLAFRIKYNYPSQTSDESVSIVTYGSANQVAEVVEPKKTEGPKVEGYDPANPTEGQEIVGDLYANNAGLCLDLRALAWYSYEYADKIKQARYQLETADKKIPITIIVTALITYEKSPGTPNGGYVPNETHKYTRKFFNSVDYNGRFDEFLYLQTETPDSKSPGNFVTRKVSLLNASKITVQITLPQNSNYKSLNVTKEFTIANGNLVTWKEDFLFERQDDPGWLSGNSALTNVGSFTLKDDDSLERESGSGAALPTSGIDPAPENFISGYREIQDPNDSLVLVSNVQALTKTPGLYFIVQARSVDAPAPQIWSYRDDQASLLFWKSQAAQTKYRVVPFSTGGMRKLISNVTKGKLLEAVSLPESLIPKPLDVDTGIDFERDPVSKLDSAYSNSVTQIGMDFEKVPTAIYNWEVFFHNPLLVATQLSQAQRFKEAQRWFHLIFDPTTNEPGLESVRYWRFLPFREAGKGVAIDKLLEDLAKQGSSSLTKHINEWAENPFRPHLIARHRLRSYQFAVVQKYLENLIAWGDQLFRRDTIETINEATQLYVLAAKILGKRPATSPKTESSPRSYRDIYRKLDAFSNAWIPLEGLIAKATLAFYPNGINSTEQEHDTRERDREIPLPLYNLGSLYFCVPGNEKLSEYWHTVDDRLFKIRHCMNIEGIERQLPLFEPPIDPALLVRATAAGLDLATVLSGLDAPLPLYRFNVMMQKALELCGEVRAVGNTLLSALEKQDAEQLSLLRSSHEIQMLKLVRAIKEQQQKEAEINLEALRKTREITAQRYVNYQRLMGKQNVVVPIEGSVATRESSTLQLAPPSAGNTDTESLALISAEAGNMGWLNDANNFSLIAGSHAVLAGVFHALPDFIIGPIVYQAKMGGSHLGSATSAAGAAWSMLATNASFQAGSSATIGVHQRRYDEWRFQSNTAAMELEQIDKQILANEIRKQIAVGEIANHDQQMENSQKVDEVMRDKFTNQQLYSWMVGQISSVYFRTYQLAHDISKRAERTYRFELGLKESSFIEFGYWDSLKKGLLSGERLYLDLKRMDVAYLDKNKREYEITKHVSVMQLDPMALLLLKETGECEVSIPEALFDLDFPGHYLRRIKSVSLTIPCVTGPYSSVPCTLTLLKHSVRHSSNASGNYTRDIENDDPRFIDSFGAIQSIVTSSAQNDSGLFETNLRDERYLPFEGAGVVSTWRVELPREFRQFDYGTISDVILHIRYTAREGGELLKTSAVKNMNALVKNAEAAGSVRLFSVRHEYPTEWAKFQGQTPGDNQRHELTVKLRPEHYPFWSQGRLKKVLRVDILVRSSKPRDQIPAELVVFDKVNDIPPAPATKKDTLAKNPALGDLLRGTFTGGATGIALPEPVGELGLFFDDKAMSDLWIAVTWGGK